MSALIRLEDGCWIDPDLVAEVKVNETARTATVRMHSGIGHTLHVGFSNSIFRSAEEVVTRINEARTK